MVKLLDGIKKVARKLTNKKHNKSVGDSDEEAIQSHLLELKKELS